MNVFILHPSPVVSASFLVDDHVAFVTTVAGRKPSRGCKMAIEAGQLLSAAHWFGVTDAKVLMQGPRELWPAPYKPTHQNHPWALSARSSVEAYRFVWAHGMALLDEHRHRTGKELDKVRAALVALETPPQWMRGGRWPIPVCRANSNTVYVATIEEAVRLYRRYYLQKIDKMPRFTNRNRPEWA